MNPLLLNTYDIGGAANSCLRLHEGLLKNNIDSKVLLLQKFNDIAGTIKFNHSNQKKTTSQKITNKRNQILQKLGLLNYNPDNFLDKRNNGLELFSYPNTIYDITASKFYQEADIINLHWVANFIDYSSFFKKNKKPIVWTLHDENPFSDGEHYNEQYLGVAKNGLPIKREITAFEKEKFKQIRDIKLEALSNVTNLTIVSPSNWLAIQSKKSATFNSFPTKVIPYGLNSDVFKPRDKEYSRELLNIPKNKKVILFVADSLTNKRKGYEYLTKALERINNNAAILCSVGAKINSENKSNNIIEFGCIKDELLMSILYSAADVFVIPSLMDNLPNTVLESIMCGTPVIGFPVGGIVDMIKNGENGYICDDISVNCLSDTIQSFIRSNFAFDPQKIRDKAIMKYDSNIQAKKYIELYHSILEKK